MTTLNQAREAVYDRFVDNWADQTDYVFDNEHYDEPEPVAGNFPPWVRVSVRNITGGQETLGEKGIRKYRRRAIAFCQVFVPVDKGMQMADTLAQSFRGIFEGESFNGLDFDNGLVREASPDGHKMMVLVEVYYAYYETK